MRTMRQEALAAACKVVKDYEDAIGRPASRRAVVRGADGELRPAPMLGEAGPRFVVAYAPRCAEHARFARAADAALEGALPRRARVEVAPRTPPAMRKAGFLDAPITASQGTVAHAVEDGIPRQAVRRLPELVERPVAMWAGPDGRTVTALLEAVCDGAPLAVRLKPNDVVDAKGGPALAHVATWVGRRPGVEASLAWAAAQGRVVAVDMDKCERLLRACGMECPSELRELGGGVHGLVPSIRPDEARKLAAAARKVARAGARPAPRPSRARTAERGGRPRGAWWSEGRRPAHGIGR